MLFHHQTDFSPQLKKDVGNPLSPATLSESSPASLASLDAMALLERMSFWRFHMERCICCYACRNACPPCVCRDHCIVGTREPHWVSQQDMVTEKLYSQTVHAFHLAGGCTECGECERTCPLNISILSRKRHMNRVIQPLFEYRAGIGLYGSEHGVRLPSEPCS